MTGLEEAKKKFWYDSNYDKETNHWKAGLDLLTFRTRMESSLGVGLDQNKMWRYRNG